MPATWVETRDIPLGELTPFPGNAKRGNVAEIRKSIRRNGQFRAIIVRKCDDGQLVILAGNHTYEALTAEEYANARCEVITCTDDEAVRINLADNRVAELGEFDDNAVLELLKSLDEDLEGTGYDPDYFDDLLAVHDEMPVLDPQPTNAAFAETPEQIQARTDRHQDAAPRTALGMREVVLVLTSEQYEELQGHLAVARRSQGPDSTASTAILASLRTVNKLLADCAGADDCAWCQSS